MGVVVWQLLTRHAEPYPDVPDLMAVVHGYAASGPCVVGSRMSRHGTLLRMTGSKFVAFRFSVDWLCLFIRMNMYVNACTVCGHVCV
jgi:hypothetical protein